MNTRELIRQALYDAIDWQRSLADAWQKGTPERQAAIVTCKEYRKILQRRYGTSKTPWETFDENATTVTIDELRKRQP